MFGVQRRLDLSPLDANDRVALYLITPDEAIENLPSGYGNFAYPGKSTSVRAVLIALFSRREEIADTNRGGVSNQRVRDKRQVIQTCPKANEKQ